MRRGLEAAAVMLALAGALSPLDPWTVEEAFSTAWYPRVQHVLTPLTNLVPFALFDILTLGAAVALVVTVVRVVRTCRRERRWQPLLTTLRRLAVSAAIVYLAFLLLWGFNYQRPRMGERLLFARGAPSTHDVVALGREAVARLNALHEEAHAIGWHEDPRADATLVREFTSVQSTLADTTPAVLGRLKSTVYGAYFRWTGVDGMVNPFALEVLANPDLLPFERPMVAAHEWAHLAGYAHEAEANFVGFLTCARASVPSQYSGWLYLYWQVSGEVGAEARKQMAGALEAGPRRDLDAIIERLRRGQFPLLRRASWMVYDHYLRANRVDEGVRAYGAVITLLLRAKMDRGWTPVRRHPRGSSR